ncbi:spore germination protein Q [Cohnella sp. OV330]|uniref:spore coat protein GerQ n=1 Tax=Cohnella sp. OV330 TaxID=1855288 RepID=UPI0008DF7604|nr:spore coat protein GerQ [Cohnella sp. OV330]SFA95842.1 spore germination protein Q [Cohnella sp. OV330]
MYNQMAWPQRSMQQMPMNATTAAQPNVGMMPAMPSGMVAVPNGSMPMNMMPPAAMPISNPGVATFIPAPGREESYVENILRMNLGKVATLYMTYENNSEWNAKIFKGVLEAAGRDHIIISDPATGMRFLLLTLNLDYITFDEPLNYNLPFGTAGNPITRR